VIHTSEATLERLILSKIENIKVIPKKSIISPDRQLPIGEVDNNAKAS